jgi:hypothetical protein
MMQLFKAAVAAAVTQKLPLLKKFLLSWKDDDLKVKEIINQVADCSSDSSSQPIIQNIGERILSLSEPVKTGRGGGGKKEARPIPSRGFLDWCILRSK